ncbi:hypothetical protein N656DRAFT_763510 [Canariomyces notabilis]|uniref:Uncharacterized protein n=1 Tax=Canariomyces notabilis TaxID=2074819 RepID=A0AAN6T7X0_9PEZI|nr:hypothetical protein N656DRAFT_763510 [Canariomyces arenarius]
MDDPDDSCWSWPHWKFGLKREDLFTKLHEQYNTIPSSIQDPEAFHHDVYEISHEANSADEFHRLLEDRKRQRLRELNDSLESASFEIIANPSLIGTEQWQHAVQLFRTRSLDSLVRYFASYLPQDHPWYKAPSSASASDAGSSVGSMTSSHGSLFDDDDGPIMTDEPLEYSTALSILPPSPRSMTMCSDSSVASPIDDAHCNYGSDPLTPARTLSFSESEPDCCPLPESHSHSSHDEASQAVSAKPAAAPMISKVDITSPQTKTSPKKYHHHVPIQVQSPVDASESSTPTPKPEGQSTAFFDTKPCLQHRRHRSLSPSHPHPLSDRELDYIYTAHHRDPRNSQLSRVKRECSPVVQRTRRSPGEPASRIQKPLPETSRSRPRGRRWVDSGC